jgi:hypothetical protein
MMIICQATKGSSHVYWMWRLVDGKRCWYEGHRLVNKANLQWHTPQLVVSDEVVIARKFYTTEELAAATPAVPQAVAAPENAAVPVRERIAAGFGSLQPPAPVLLDMVNRPLASGELITTVEPSASPSRWPDLGMIAMTIAVIIIGYMVLRAVTAAFGEVGRLQ